MIFDLGKLLYFFFDFFLGPIIILFFYFCLSQISLLCRYVGRVIGSTYGEGSGPIWLDDVECRGSETFIGDCLHRSWGSHDCRHHEDVSISCTSNFPRTTTTAAPPPSSRLGTTRPRCPVHVSVMSCLNYRRHNGFRGIIDHFCKTKTDTKTIVENYGLGIVSDGIYRAIWYETIPFQRDWIALSKSMLVICYFMHASNKQLLENTWNIMKRWFKTWSQDQAQDHCCQDQNQDRLWVVLRRLETKTKQDPRTNNTDYRNTEWDC